MYTYTYVDKTTFTNIYWMYTDIGRINYLNYLIFKVRDNILIIRYASKFKFLNI